MSKIIKESFPNPETDVGNLIKRRRLQVLVHSCLYYGMDESLVPDNVFDKWCKDLVQLLKDNPNEYSDRFDIYFKDWDGISGYDLPIRDPWIWNKALRLLEVQNGIET